MSWDLLLMTLCLCCLQLTLYSVICSNSIHREERQSIRHVLTSYQHDYASSGWLVDMRPCWFTDVDAALVTIEHDAG